MKLIGLFSLLTVGLALARDRKVAAKDSVLSEFDELETDIKNVVKREGKDAAMDSLLRNVDKLESEMAKIKTGKVEKREVGPTKLRTTTTKPPRTATKIRTTTTKPRITTTKPRITVRPTKLHITTTKPPRTTTTKHGITTTKPPRTTAKPRITTTKPRITATATTSPGQYCCIDFPNCKEKKKIPYICPHCPKDAHRNKQEKNKCCGECEVNKPCHESATRLNGTCTCNVGYSGNGIFCFDIDDCAGDVCRQNSTCVDLLNKFDCPCNHGFIDVNETCESVCKRRGCPTDNGFCVLMNETSAECRCDDNYLLVNGTCQKKQGIVLSMSLMKTFDDSLNDSSTPQFVELAAKVEKDLDGYLLTQNIPGYVGVQVLSFSPGSVITDFSILIAESIVINTTNIKDVQNKVVVGVADGKLDNIKVNKSRVIDVNECFMDHPCHASATCTNTMSNYTCACNSGYHGDGFVCTDTDECANGAHNCHAELATCENTAGAFQCHCNKGYHGNGRECNVKGKEADKSKPDDTSSASSSKNHHLTLIVVLTVVVLLVVIPSIIIYNRYEIRACLGKRYKAFE